MSCHLSWLAPVLLGLSSAQAAPLEPAVEVVMASDLVDRGLSSGPHAPVVQAGLSIQPGGQWIVSSTFALGTTGYERATLHLSRYYTLSDDWVAELGADWYGYRSRRVQGERYVDLAASIVFRDLLSLSATVVHYPDWPGPGPGGLQRALDGGLRWPLPGGWSAVASIGVADVPPRPAYRYDYGSLGLAYQHGDWRAGINRIATDGTARALLGDVARPVWSAYVARDF